MGTASETPQFPPAHPAAGWEHLLLKLLLRQINASSEGGASHAPASGGWRGDRDHGSPAPVIWHRARVRRLPGGRRPHALRAHTAAPAWFAQEPRARQAGQGSSRLELGPHCSRHTLHSPRPTPQGSATGIPHCIHTGSCASRRVPAPWGRAEERGLAPPTGPEPLGAQVGLGSPPSLAILLPHPGLTGLGAQSSPLQNHPVVSLPLSFWAIMWSCAFRGGGLRVAEIEGHLVAPRSGQAHWAKVPLWVCTEWAGGGVDGGGGASGGARPSGRPLGSRHWMDTCT